jgi:hypothetical protein
MRYCSLTGWNDVNHPSTRSTGLRKYVNSAIYKVNEWIILLLHFITMRDAQNDSASGAIKKLRLSQYDHE